MLIGLVGKTNVGKSTFFKACTLANVEIGNRPFVTIRPNRGIGYIKINCIDKEFNAQCQPRTGYCINRIRFVPVELLDVAGLVKGASEGRGLGNQFLDDLRQADVFIQIVDASGETDIEGKPTKSYNPVQDVKMLENEIDFWYTGILTKVWKTFARTLELKKENFVKAVAKQFSGLKVSEDDVKKVLLKLENAEKPAEWTNEQLFNFAHELRRATKPVVIAANKIDRPDAAENLNKLKKEYPELTIIPCSADSELALREAGKAGLIEHMPGDKDFKVLRKLTGKQEEALSLIKKNVLDLYNSTGIQQVLNTAIFELLKYIVVFPVENGNKLSDSKGNILPDAILLPQSSVALDLAYAVHTDLGRNFVKAIDVRTKKAVGKEYKLRHRDVIEILAK